MTSNKKNEIIFLFDVDGTLSPSRQKASEDTLKMLKNLKKSVSIAFVGGSDLVKQFEQIGPDLLNIFDFGFPENGVQFYKGKELQSSESFISFLGEKNYLILLNEIFRLFSLANCPVKRSHFIELRKSMLNISPIGRECSQAERLEFFEFDKINLIRKGIAEELTKKFGDLMNIQCSIGGQISIDIFPKGWDKTYCLRHVKHEKIYFFGDMTEIGGNDHEIFKHERVIGTKVLNPEDTIKKVKERLAECGIVE
jgi:phosphomannomutase